MYCVFLGKSRPEVFNGELKGRLQHRPEGVRLKHVVNGNSLKIYDKEGQILRVETTIYQPRDFRVFRPTRYDPNQGMNNLAKFSGLEVANPIRLQ
jgi:hypothetical protein